MEINIILNPKVSFLGPGAQAFVYVCWCACVSVFMYVNACVGVFLQCYLIYSKTSVYSLGVFVFPLCGIMPNPGLSVQNCCAKNMTNVCVLFLYLELSTRGGNKVTDGSSCH